MAGFAIAAIKRVDKNSVRTLELNEATTLGGANRLLLLPRETAEAGNLPTALLRQLLRTREASRGGKKLTRMS
jgi:hypothetical protein